MTNITYLPLWYDHQTVTVGDMTQLGQGMYTVLTNLTQNNIPCILTQDTPVSGSGSISCSAAFVRYENNSSLLGYPTAIYGQLDATVLAGVVGDGFIVARYSASAVTPTSRNIVITSTYLFTAAPIATTDCIVAVITAGAVTAQGNYIVNKAASIVDAELGTRIDIAITPASLYGSFHYLASLLYPLPLNIPDYSLQYVKMYRNQNNTVFGENAFNDTATGARNIMLGYGAGSDLAGGGYNVLLGDLAGASLTGTDANSSSFNILIGANAGNTLAGTSTNTVTNNIMIGQNAGLNLVNVANSIYIGLDSGTQSAPSSPGGLNTCIGVGSGANISSTSQMIALGVQSGEGATNASYSVCVGDYAGVNISGEKNVGVGYQALARTGGGLTGNNTSVLGASSINLIPATSTNCTILGANATVSADNEVQLGDPATVVWYYTSITARSDARDKADIRDTILGLEFIRKLQPKDFKFDYRGAYRKPFTLKEPVKPINIEAADYKEQLEQYKLDYKNFEICCKKWEQENCVDNIVRDGTHKRKRFHHGFIAQDIEKLIQDGVIEDFGGYIDCKKTGGYDALGLNYPEFIAPLVQATKELADQVDELKDQIKKLKKTKE